MLKDATRIGLFPGSFNPIGNHHVFIANELIKAGWLDQIIFLPCAVSLHHKILASFEHRFRMCQIHVQGNDRLGISRFEFENPGLQPYETIQGIMKSLPFAEFYVILGEDNARSIRKWADSESCISFVPFIVVSRNNEKKSDSNLWFHNEPHRFFSLEE